MNTIRDILQINDQELQRGIAGTAASWHSKYEKSAWIYVGNLDHSLTEGDIICVLSQYGEIDDLHLVRDESTGKSRGFAFCKYIDARSCILAVDNFTVIQLCGRSLRVDHVENYRLPKHLLEKEEHLELLAKSEMKGLAYHGQELASQFSLHDGLDLFAPPAPKNTNQTLESVPAFDEVDDHSARHGEKKRRKKKEKREKRERKESRKREREEDRDHRGDRRRKERKRRT